MSDYIVTVVENPITVDLVDQPVEVFIQEDNYTVTVNSPVTQVEIKNEDVSILTIAEQGPPGPPGSGSGGNGGLFPIYVGTTPPPNAQIGDLWLNTN